MYACCCTNHHCDPSESQGQPSEVEGTMLQHFKQGRGSTQNKSWILFHKSNINMNVQRSKWIFQNKYYSTYRGIKDGPCVVRDPSMSIYGRDESRTSTPKLFDRHAGSEPRPADVRRPGAFAHAGRARLAAKLCTSRIERIWIFMLISTRSEWLQSRRRAHRSSWGCEALYRSLRNIAGQWRTT